MNLIPWRTKQHGMEPIGRAVAPPVQRLRSELNRLFDRFLEEPFGGLEQTWPGLGPWGPSLDVSESKTHVIVKAELPGIDPKKVDITIAGSTLSISGEKSEGTERNDESYYHSERRFGSFRREVQLPTYVDSEKVSAEYAHGVLIIQLEKQKSATPKHVPVKAIS